MEPSTSSQRAHRRDKYRAKIQEALNEDADPLAAYDDFVKWTLDSYSEAELAQSGILELLEEATRRFVEDVAYKTDLRYLKLWLLYASHVEDPAAIYTFILAHDIGTLYALAYQEYANALERNGRRAEAESVYRKGIERRARPLDPLKKRYEDFKKRTNAPPGPSPKLADIWKSAPPSAQALRRNPLQNHPSAAKLSAPGPSSSQSSSNSRNDKSTRRNDPYALMRAPPAPGKRPEKLRFNLSLLFTEDGGEYSMQEARARSMGLLGKKWGPPPASELSRAVRVEFNDDGRNTRTTRKGGFSGGEPTMTLATKEALADVLGMYNSPEKSTRYGVALGSKHAPVRKVEPVTPMALQPQLSRAAHNENANVPVKTPSQPIFRPFVDENAGRKENHTPAAPKYNVFVDPEPSVKPPSTTPRAGRPILSLKDASTPSISKTGGGEIAPSRSANVFTPAPEEIKPAVFSAVFTPAARPLSRQDIFIDDEEQDGNTSPFEAPGPNVFHASTPAKENAPASKIPHRPEPFVPVTVFSRPPPQNENPPKTPVATFKPFVDDDAQPSVPAAVSSGRPVLAPRTPLGVFMPKSAPVEEPEPVEDSYYDEEGEYEEYDHIPTGPEGGDMDEADYDEDEDFNRQAPLGGRLGRINVMTPITERTFEFTSTIHSRPSGTPSKMGLGIAVYRDGDAVEAAEQLAAELREDDQVDEGQEAEEYEEEYDDEVRQMAESVAIENKTEALAQSNTLIALASFKPPNPCNPFDPPIVSTLLSIIPSERDFHDLRQQESQQLDVLQKFAKKKTRRASGNSSSSRGFDDSDMLDIVVADRKFSIVDKLGEGGFGAVFEAIDAEVASQDNLDSDFEDDEDEDSDEKGKVALKIVKPRNLWEFHVLRRIHSRLPPRLRQSLVSPHALYAFRDESFLVLDLCKQGTLLNIVNRAAAAGITQQGACLDELLVMFFAIELMRLLEGLHRCGFIHGDVKIDNCLLRLEDVPGPASAWTGVYDPSGGGGWAYKGIKMIDFGRTVDTSLFPAGQAYIAEWPTDARDCVEMREGRPWTFQTDYFGLAGIVYCMLYGKYIEASSIAPVKGAGGETRYKLATPFKRYWQVELWTRLFDVLLNPCLVRPDGQLPLCEELGGLREEMETWLAANCNRASNTLKGLIKKIGLAVLGGKDGR